MILRLSLAVALILFLAAAGFWFLAPREPVDTTVAFDPAVIGNDPDAYLLRSEADIPNLRPNAQKEIVWAFPASRAKTPLALVYVHGFSATKAETRPLADQIAKALDANLFYTRLTGHGRNPAALEQARVNDWLNDLAEAIAIGRTIGNRVIVIGTSTGGTLATLGATIPGLMDNVQGLVLISPNFGLQNRWAFLLNIPYARTILPRIGGATHGFEPVNREQAENWTTRYPIGALAPMAALIRTTLAANWSGISIPALALFSPDDRIADPTATETVLASWGAPTMTVTVPASGDPQNHVIAGHILSPETTDALAERISAWISALPSP